MYVNNVYLASFDWCIGESWSWETCIRSRSNIIFANWKICITKDVGHRWKSILNRGWRYAGRRTAPLACGIRLSGQCQRVLLQGKLLGHVADFSLQGPKPDPSRTDSRTDQRHICAWRVQSCCTPTSPLGLCAHYNIRNLNSTRRHGHLMKQHLSCLTSRHSA